jgi:hypothetical protein
MKSRMSRREVLWVPMMVLILIVACNERDKHKPDEVLISAFQHHREDFEQLRKMAAAETNLLRLDAYESDSEELISGGVSPKRIAEYRRLFNRVGCPEGLMLFPARPGIRIVSSNHGLLDSGSSKGYCYLETVPPLVVTNTDKYRPEPSGPYEVYRKIEGSWYIFLEHGAP